MGLWLCDFVLIACCQLKWSSSHLYMKSTSWFQFFFFFCQFKHSNLSLTLIKELFPDESSDTSSGTSCQTHISSRVPHPSNDLHLWEVIYLQIYKKIKKKEVGGGVWVSLIKLHWCEARDRGIGFCFHSNCFTAQGEKTGQQLKSVLIAALKIIGNVLKSSERPSKQ